MFALCAEPMSAAGEQEPLRLSDIAGKYWSSDGGDRRWTLTIRKNGSFTSTRLVGDRVQDIHQPREGVASVSNGRLSLMVPPSEDAFSFLPVRLGKRMYLVRPEGILDFCIALAEGREPRVSDVGDALLRVGDEGVAVPKGLVPALCAPPGP